MTIPEHVRPLSALCLALTAAQLGAESGVPLRIVPFEPARSPFVVIQVPIKDHGCAPLLFDTGTNLSIVDPTLARRLTVRGNRPLAAVNASGRATVSLTMASGIGFEPALRETASPAVTAEMSALHATVARVEGIFGQSLVGEHDYYIDYKARRLTFGAPGTLGAGVAGARLPLEWSEGRPAIAAVVRRSSVAPLPGRVVLDSGVDRVTLFGRMARELGSGGAAATTVVVHGPFGATHAPAVDVEIVVGDYRLAVRATLVAEVTDRQEDGLLPTSLFESVFVSTHDRAVVLDGVLRMPTAESAVTNCASR